MKGLQVFPGIIDSDYEGEIKVMAAAPRTIVTIKSGDKVAQLVLLPFMPTGHVLSGHPRKKQGFGSSDFAYWIQKIGTERPTRILKVGHIYLHGILDTGADVSVISSGVWPEDWPLVPAMTTLRGIGQSQNPMQSAEFITWSDKEGHQGTFQPYVLPHLPTNLWGRDVLSEMGALLYSPSPEVTNQMLNQGYDPTKGLGKNQQGMLQPFVPQTNSTRAGLGYQNLS